MTYDLEDWPDAWTEMNQTALVALLRIAIATAHLPGETPPTYSFAVAL